MEYEIWIKNDINFIATLITKILPALDPGQENREDSCVPLYRDEKRITIISPYLCLEGKKPKPEWKLNEL